MEEAEALSDRIMILKKGKTQCIGDSMTLKDRYAKKYNISLEPANPDDIEEIRQILEQQLTGQNRMTKLRIDEKTTNSGEIIKRIKFEAEFGSIKKIFESITLGGDLHGKLANWEFNQPSLDDVFMTVAK